MVYTFIKMKLFLKRIVILGFFSIIFLSMHAQEVGDVQIEKVYDRQSNMSLFINTSGYGIGYQFGWSPTYKDKHLLDFDFYYSNHEKAIKGRNLSFEGARAFSYGKLYDLFFIRSGYKYQRTTHHKPYWGGVEVGFFLTAGATLGIGVPTYLEVAYLSPNGYDFVFLIERYNPNVHDLSNIVGGAPFYERFHHFAFRPGFYGKMGLSFDFSSSEYRIRALEVGISVDVLLPTIQQMAFNEPKKLFLEAYIAYCFGSKKVLYE